MSDDVLRVCRALDFAARTHVNQRRKGVAQEPYINHLSEVALLLAEATGGADANLVIARRPAEKSRGDRLHSIVATRRGRREKQRAE